jgi:hypothetical protein
MSRETAMGSAHSPRKERKRIGNDEMSVNRTKLPVPSRFGRGNLGPLKIRLIWAIGVPLIVDVRCGG